MGATVRALTIRERSSCFCLSCASLSEATCQRNPVGNDNGSGGCRNSQSLKRSPLLGTTLTDTSFEAGLGVGCARTAVVPPIAKVHAIAQAFAQPKSLLTGALQATTAMQYTMKETGTVPRKLLAPLGLENEPRSVTRGSWVLLGLILRTKTGKRARYPADLVCWALWTV